MGIFLEYEMPETWIFKIEDILKSLKNGDILLRLDIFSHRGLCYKNKIDLD